MFQTRSDSRPSTSRPSSAQPSTDLQDLLAELRGLSRILPGAKPESGALPRRTQLADPAPVQRADA